MTRPIKTRLVFFFISLAIAGVLFAVSLQRSSPELLPPIPTMDLRPTAYVETSTEIVLQRETSQASTLSAQAAVEAHASATAQAQTAASAAQAEQTAQAQFALQTAVSNATAEALPMQELLQTLSEQGTLASTNGYFLALPDFDNTWNKKGRYQWWDTGYDMENFVLLANIAWDSANPQSGNLTSGCGFIFADNGPENQHRVFLTLDGTAHLYRVANGSFMQVKERYYDRLDIPGSARVALVVDDGTVTFLVNGSQVFQVEDDTLGEGSLSYAISSGIDDGFGIRCSLTGIGLWTLSN